MIIHIDCNSFFASCEVAFHPELYGKPVAVANINEAGGGVILALTAEAKRLGLKRGIPVFQAKKLIQERGVVLLPTNHDKYRKTSNKIMQLVVDQDIIQNFVQYSIDEFFGEIPIDNEAEVRHYVSLVKDLIRKETDIPVSCGCSQTYTLAKVATWYSKHYDGYKGICILSEANRQKALKSLPVGDVWGIGSSFGRFMADNSIATALDFAQLSEAYVRHYLKTGGLHTWQELHGIRSIDINRDPVQKSMSHSQTLAYMTDDKQRLRELVSEFTSKLARKLREQKSMCQTVTVFIRTNRHRTDLPQYSAGDSRKLVSPSQDTRDIMNTALQLLDSLFIPGFMYKKIGIILSDITPAEAMQMDLFSGNDILKSKKLMQALDDINRKYGDKAIHSALVPDVRQSEISDDESAEKAEEPQQQREKPHS